MKLALEDFPENIPFNIFNSLDDPRIDRQKHHSLEAILVISVCAVLCDCDTWVDIADFAQDHQNWFAQFLDLPYGVPSHDTFGRVFALLSPEAFEEVFIQWVKETFKIQEGEIIAIDGKTTRGSQKGGIKGTGLHIVSAWATQAGIVLREVPTEDKSNEITVIPFLLEKFELKHCTVTLDAMGCQHKIVDKISERKGDYCIAVKGNQLGLFDELNRIFSEDRLKNLEERPDQHYMETIEKSHGRIEKRQYYSLDAKKWLSKENQWSGIKSVNLVTSQRIQKDKTTFERRLYISSHLANADLVGPIIRGHWSIENNLHWSLDVTFQEDHLQTKIKSAVQNIGLVRKFALNLLKKERNFKGSLRRKRKKASRDFGYLFKVIMPLLM